MVASPKLSSETYVAELIYPGTRIVSEDRNWAFRIEGLISSLESSLSETAVALNLFIEENKAPSQFPDSQQDHDNSFDEKEYHALLEKLDQAENSSDALREVFKYEIETKRKKWAEGFLPEDYKRRLIFIYARAFLLSMHMIGKTLSILTRCETPLITEAVKNCNKSFDDTFPHLKGVRDSEMHMEERLQGLAKGKPIDIQPIDTELMKINGQIMVISNLNGTKFSATMENGQLGEVDVSLQSLNDARECIQGVIKAFPWEGNPSHYPS